MTVMGTDAGLMPVPQKVSKLRQGWLSATSS